MENLSKMIRTSIKMEEEGIDFYQEAAEKTSHPFGKKMFLSFVEDEKRHLTVLRSILAGFKFSDFDRFFEEKTPKEKIPRRANRSWKNFRHDSNRNFKEIPRQA